MMGLKITLILQLILAIVMFIIGAMRAIKLVREIRSKRRETEWKMKVFLESVERR